MKPRDHPVSWALIFLVFLASASDTGAGLPTRFPPAPRIVAVGDLHGDIEATIAVLQLAGAIDDDLRWSGGDLVLVQTGDQLDRGGDDRVVIDLLERLKREAADAGGAVHVLNGNHEMMNVALDLRYVVDEGFASFSEFARGVEVDSLLATFPEEHRGRVVAFRPGGPYAKILAERNCVTIIGDNVFVHGGVLPEHIEYGIERLNADLRAWMLGEGPCPEGIHDRNSVTWTRTFSLEVDDEDCPVLAGVLERLGAKRLIVGHTVQEEGINSYCQGSVWCIDVGMSAHYGGTLQALEIRGDSVRVLTAEPAIR
jgi:hypothetical protein